MAQRRSRTLAKWTSWIVLVCVALGLVVVLIVWLGR